MIMNICAILRSLPHPADPLGRRDTRRFYGSSLRGPKDEQDHASIIATCHRHDAHFLFGDQDNRCCPGPCGNDTAGIGIVEVAFAAGYADGGLVRDVSKRG